VGEIPRGVERSHRLISVFDGILVVLSLLFIVGHLNPGKSLDPVTKHISSYASSAPWAWMILSCMALLGAAYLLIAYGLIKHLHHHDAGAIAALALAVAGALLFFVALYPTWTAGARQTRDIGYWERLRMAATGRTAELTDIAERDKVAAIHDQLIQSSTAFLLMAQLAVACALWSESSRRRYSWGTLLLAALGLTAFSLSKAQPAFAGLWQRTGFVVILSWMLFVGRRFIIFPPTGR
jgi:hypothetical protein